MKREVRTAAATRSIKFIVCFTTIICCYFLHAQLAHLVSSTAGQIYQFPVPAGIRSVSIDIGLYDSIIEPLDDELVIAVDASLREVERFKLASKCYEMKRCLLINAAVGSSLVPFATLHQSKREGGSSHITNYDSTIWPMDMRPAVVPLLSLKTIIDAVPPNMPINMCKTDTNGNDVYVVESAGNTIRRCLRLTIEIVGPEDGTGPPDQYERIMDLMNSMGFKLAPGFPAEKQQRGSYDLRFIGPNFDSNTEVHTFY